MPKRSPLTGSSQPSAAGATPATTSDPPASSVPAVKGASSAAPRDISHYEAAIRNLEELLAGTGAHAEHTRKQVGRCVLCSCGTRVQGRMAK